MTLKTFQRSCFSHMLWKCWRYWTVRRIANSSPASTAYREPEQPYQTGGYFPLILLRSRGVSLYIIRVFSLFWPFFSPQVTPNIPLFLIVQSHSEEPILSHSHSAIWRCSRPTASTYQTGQTSPGDLELLVAVRTLLEVAYCCCHRNIAPHLSDQERRSRKRASQNGLSSSGEDCTPGPPCLSFPCLHYRITSNKHYLISPEKTMGVKA